MAGYIQLHRKLLESVQFQNPNYLKIWIWMLLKAAHKPMKFNMTIGKVVTGIQVQRGQLVFGRNRAQEQLGLDASLIYRCLKKFEKESAITIKSNTLYSIITICNYDDYNEVNKSSEQPSNNHRTTIEQPSNTYNNYNNDKEVNKESISFLSETSAEVQTEKKKNGNKWIETFDQRKKDFQKEVALFLKSNQNPSGYPKEMLREFFDFWTEPNRSRSRMKHETEKTWDLGKRLAYWDRRGKEKSTPTKPAVQESPTYTKFVNHND